MKALVLAAGLGTRLRPLTNNIPKVMVKIGDRPLLYYHITQLRENGIRDIWINLHYFPEIIKKYFGDGTRFGVKISYSYESPKILGTAGSLKNPNSSIEKEFSKGRFLVVYGDNLTNFNYKKLINFHKSKSSMMTIGLYNSCEPWTKGVVVTNGLGKVLEMVEKPPKDMVQSNQVNAGIYVCEKEVLNYIQKGFSDFGFDVIPKLLRLQKPVFGLDTNSFVQDIGTPEGLKTAKLHHFKYLKSKLN